MTSFPNLIPKICTRNLKSSWFKSPCCEETSVSLHFLLFHNLQIKRMIVKDQSQYQNFISPYWLPLFSRCKFWELLVLIISPILNTNCMTMHKSVRRNQNFISLAICLLGTKHRVLWIFYLSACQKPHPMCRAKKYSKHSHIRTSGVRTSGSNFANNAPYT